MFMWYHFKPHLVIFEPWFQQHYIDLQLSTYTPVLYTPLHLCWHYFSNILYKEWVPPRFGLRN